MESVAKVGRGWSEQWAGGGAPPQGFHEERLKRNVPLFPLQKAESRVRLKTPMPGPQDYGALTRVSSRVALAHRPPPAPIEPTSLGFQLGAPFSKTSPACSEVLQLKFCVIPQRPSQRPTLTTLQRTEVPRSVCPRALPRPGVTTPPSSLPLLPAAQGTGLARGPFSTASRAPEACTRG